MAAVADAVVTAVAVAAVATSRIQRRILKDQASIKLPSGYRSERVAGPMTQIHAEAVHQR